MPTILTRMGGVILLDKLVPVFYESVWKDSVLNPIFIHSTKTRIIELQTAFLTTLLSSGVSEESRETMMSAYEGMELKDSHFDLIEGHFRKSISSVNLADEIVNDFMEAIKSTRPLLLGYKAQVKSMTIDFEGNEKTVIIVDGDATDVYTQLGGRYSIYLIVKKMYVLLWRDPEIKAFFSSLNVGRVQSMFEFFLAAALTESLTDEMQEKMKLAHASINLTNHHFDLFKSFLIKAAGDFEVPSKICKDLAGLMELFRTKVLPHVTMLGGDTSTVSDRYFFACTELYENVGGENAIDFVVNYFLRHVLDHESLGSFFRGIDMKKQFNIQKKFLTIAIQEREIPENSIAGMKAAHKTFCLDNSDFDAFKGLMREAFGKLELMDTEILDEIMSRLEVYRGVIVHNPNPDFQP